MIRSLKIFAVSAGLATLFSAILWKTGVYEDAYITFRYARNLAHGLGAVYNPGERVEGCTAFLQMIVLAPFALLKMNLALVSVAVSILGQSLVAVLGYRKIRSTDASVRGETWAYFYWAMIVAGAPMVQWTVSAMETMWFTAALVGAVFAAEREMAAERKPLASSAIAVVAALIRPEGVMLAFTLALSWVLFAAKGRKLRDAAVFSALFAAGYSAYFLWRFSYYGDLFPNTYYAKVDELSVNLALRGFVYLVRVYIAGIVPLAALALLASVVTKRIPFARFEKIALAAAAGQSVQTVLSGGDFMPYFRFLVPVWPLFLLLTWSFWEKARPALKFPKRPDAPERSRGHRVAMLIPVVLALNLAMGALDMNEAKVIAGANITRGMEKAADALREVAPRDALLAAVAIGAIGYVTGNPLIDMLGLTDRTIAHTKISTGSGVPGHEKFNTAYLLSRKPDLILACMEIGDKAKKNCSKVQKKYAVAAYRSLLSSSEFLETYGFYNHKFDGGVISTYVRKDKVGTPGFEGWLQISKRRTGPEGSGSQHHDAAVQDAEDPETP